jgi:choline transport protein
MGEEVHNATTVVPRSMMWCIFVNGIVGLAMYFALLFCAGDLDAALTSRFIYPFIEVLEQALSSSTGTALVITIILLVDLGLVIGVVAASSRMLWSFARDRGVPGWCRSTQVRCSALCHLSSQFQT